MMRDEAQNTPGFAVRLSRMVEDAGTARGSRTTGVEVLDTFVVLTIVESISGIKLASTKPEEVKLLMHLFLPFRIAVKIGNDRDS